MHTVEELNGLGGELERLLNLRFAPIAMKLINEDEIPEGCIRPKRDRNVHYALCQAFAAVRRERKALALFKEDHWCVWPVLSLRLEEMEAGDPEYLGPMMFIKEPRKGIEYFRKTFPVLSSRLRKEGLALAPLASCGFVPDAICVYCQPAQLRQLLMAAKFETAEIVGSSLDTVNSCGHAVVPVFNSEKPYNVSIPDPGEYERSLADEGEMIFTLARDRLDELMDGLRTIDKMGFGYKKLAFDMNLDYPRAAFYDVLFKRWGLETGKQWNPGDRN